MARKGPVKKTPIPQDTKYNSSTITKFINAIMLDGKKSIAESVLYESFKIIEDKAKTLVKSYREQVTELSKNTQSKDPLRVFVYDSGEDTPFTAGLFAMPTALIEAAGGKNIMNNFKKSWGKVTWEEVIDRNPEVIVIVNYGNVTAEQKKEFMMTNPAFAQIDAVKNNRFVTLEYVEATPGPRNIKAIKKLVKSFWKK